MGRTTEEMPPVTRHRSSVGIVLGATRGRRSTQPQVNGDQPPQGRVPAPQYDRVRLRVGKLLTEAVELDIAPKEKDEYRQEVAAADKLREDGHIDQAVEKLTTLERRVALAVNLAESSPEGKKRGGKKLRQKVAIERERAEKELLVEAALTTLPPEIDFGPIRAVMAEHKQKVPGEEKVLDEFEILDDVLTNRKLKENPEEMQKTLKGIGDAMSGAFDRQKRFAAELRKLTKPGDDAPEEQKDAYRDAWLFSAQMIAHVPQHWQAQWSPNFAKRIANLTATPEEKAKNLEDAKNAFSEQDKQRHREAMKKGIEANSTRKLDRVEFYYDRLVKAPTLQELLDLGKIHEEVMAVGTKILDSGGKLSDVRAALKHIPESWWPPAFVDYIQAWRKTEREMSRLRVAKMFEEDDLLKTGLDTVEGIMSFVGTLGTIAVPVTDHFAPKTTDSSTGKEVATPEWLKVEGVQQAIMSFAGSIQTGVGMGKEIGNGLSKEFIERENDLLSVFKSPEKMEEASAKLLELTKQTASNINLALKAAGAIQNAPGAGELMSTIIPGISIAVAGVDLYLAIRILAKTARKLHVTKTMIPEAELDWARGIDEDGGAFVRALGNEVSARKMDVSKQSVNVTDKGLTLGSSIATTAGGHYGAAVGVGLKVVGKVIVYGSKVVFTNIEWSRANTAKKLIKEAQAGSPAARIELMSDCGLYAKMYIAILAREGHPKALKFVGDRGIEESDLDGPLALKIVVEEMLKDANQPDETQVADNWLVANMEGLGLGGAIKLGKKIGGGAVAIVDAIRTIPKSSRDTPYDETWRHKKEHVALTAAAWEAGKNEAKKAGLFDYSTGVGGVFAKVEASYSKLNKAKPEEEKVCIIGVLDELDGLYGALIDFEPVTNPQGDDEKTETHKGMVLYMAELKTLVMTERTRFDELLVAKGHKDANWTTTNSSLLPNEWEAAFKDAAAKACLTDDDMKVGKRLTAYHAAATDKDLADNNPDAQKRRKALLKAYDAGTELLAALDDLYGSARECQGLRDYIDRLKDAASEQMRAWDEQIVTVLGVQWVCPADNMGEASKFAKTGWQTTWERAVEDGVVSEGKKDGGVADALGAAESALADLNKIDQKKDPKDKRKARYEYQRKLAHVFACARKCAESQKQAVQSFKDYTAAVGKWAQDQITATRTEQGDVKFTVVEGFDAKSFAKTDDNAKAAGAVGSSGGRMKKLENAIKDAVEATEKFTKASQKQDRAGEREAAADRKKALEAVTEAVDDALTAEGYSENKQMAAYLEGLKTEAQQKLGIEVYKRVLEGSSDVSGGFDPGPFEWADKAWQKVKEKAVKAGLIADKKTGFGDALTDAKEKFDTWDAAIPQGKIQAKDPAAAALNRAKRMAQQLAGGTEHAKMKTYFNRAVTLADQMLLLLETDPTAEFNPPSFEWKDSAWQKVKAEAITRGLMQDKKTGFGESLTEAKEAYDEWNKLVPAEKVKQRAGVEKKLMKSRDIAANYRDTAGNAKLANYFKQAVDRAAQMIQMLQVDGVSGVTFDPGAFQWTNASWQSMKERAIKAGVLRDSKTGFGEKLDESKKAYDKYTEAKNKSDAKKTAKARAEAYEKVEKARQTALDLKAATDHDAVKNYFDRCVSLADQMLFQMPEDLVDFSPEKFEWKDSAWQKMKKQAVELGLMADEKTGFGDKLTASLKKFNAFFEAFKEKNESKKLSTREPARAAIVEVQQAATAMKSKSRHTKLKAYLDECIEFGNKMLNTLQK